MTIDRNFSYLDRYPTPLRYPGGKQRLGHHFAKLLELNDLQGCSYIEPFCGGAGAGMFLLKRQLVKSIHLNDWNRSIYAFWYAVTRRNAKLCDMVAKCSLTLKEWDRQKAIQRHKEEASLLDLGFSTLFLNRTNKSGILSGGVIGGRGQTGKYRIDARFDKKAIIHRLSAIKPLSRNISISNDDALNSESLSFGIRGKKFIYLDPPYFSKSATLYFNSLNTNDHLTLARRMSKAADVYWVVTYDDVAKAKRMFGRRRRRYFRLSHSADKFRIGREVMYFSSNLTVPMRFA